MAGNRRKNKATKQTKGSLDAPWFAKNRSRQRQRSKIAKESRKRNRK